MSFASLAMKVIGTKLGFLKKAREGDDTVGRSVSILPHPPQSAQPPLGLQHRAESVILSLSFSAPEKAASASPFLGDPGVGVTTLPASLNPGHPLSLWLPLTPCHPALPAPCGIRDRRGIRLCKWLPPPCHPASLS